MNPTQLKPIYLDPEEGETIQILGAKIRLLTTRPDCEALTFIEYTMPPNFAGPPVHYHKQTSEAFYVMDGQLTLVIGDEVRRCGSGSYQFIPAGARHTFRNDSDAAAKCLILCSPAGFEGYFRRVAPLLKNGPPFDTDAIDKLAMEFDTYL